jgi:glutathione synthase/RimK-type ligase-like ATP-grasp enzyme
MIALATCAELPDGDVHDRALAERLGAPFVVWDDPLVDWSAFHRVVVRSTWDYSARRDEFLAWTRSIGDRLVNPAPVIEWNTDKRYVDELRTAGIPVVPTRLLAPGTPLGPMAAEIVVKPTVSAGSRDTGRFRPTQRGAAEALLDRIHASDRTAMVQPYVSSVDERGETALVYLGGVFSHAVRKAPLLGRDGSATSARFRADAVVPCTATTAERALADAVVAFVERRFETTLLYARVDLVCDAEGAPLLLELEVTEPCLFLGHAPGATRRLASALRS